MSKQSRWKRLLFGMVERYEEAAKDHRDVSLLLAYCRDSDSLNQLLCRLCDRHSRIEPTHVWKAQGSPERESGFIVGDPERITRFKQLGELTGAYLPLEIRPDRPFHEASFTKPSKKTVSNLGDWVGLVFRTLVNGECGTAISFKEDRPAQGCRIAELTIDPFEAAALAIRILSEESAEEKIVRPSEQAMRAWRLRDLYGHKQKEIASKLYGDEKCQPRVSRDLVKVKRYLEAGNSLPFSEKVERKPTPLAPDRLELGENRERRAYSQQAKTRDKQRQESGSD